MLGICFPSKAGILWLRCPPPRFSRQTPHWIPWIPMRPHLSRSARLRDRRSVTSTSFKKKQLFWPVIHRVKELTRCFVGVDVFPLKTSERVRGPKNGIIKRLLFSRLGKLREQVLISLTRTLWPVVFQWIWTRKWQKSKNTVECHEEFWVEP